MGEIWALCRRGLIWRVSKKSDGVYIYLAVSLCQKRHLLLFLWGWSSGRVSWKGVPLLNRRKNVGYGECTALAWYYLAIVDINIESRSQLFAN